MDEVSALRYIFKESMEEGGKIKITFNNSVYETTPEVARAEGYRDVYNYILSKEASCSPPKTECTPEVESSHVDIERITEEQFSDWVKSNKRPRERSLGLSGRSMWRARDAEDSCE